MWTIFKIKFVPVIERRSQILVIFSKCYCTQMEENFQIKKLIKLKALLDTY
jgi:hypothetical protein